MSGATLNISDDGAFTLTGDLSFATVPAIWQKGLEMFRNAETLTVDMSGIDRSDSAGLTLLIEWLRFARAQQKVIRYLNMPEQMLAIARVSGLDNILPIHNQ